MHAPTWHGLAVRVSGFPFNHPAPASLPLTMSKQLDLLPPDTSLTAPVGWKLAKFRDTEHTVAVCPDGFIHFPDDGAWVLEVPWFRGDNVALAYHEDGTSREVPIDSKNVITMPCGRRVTPREWHH